MKLGIFDSGLGGLLIARSILGRIPDIDLVYFGDTLHLPYGARSTETIYEYTKQAVEYLFQKDCNLVIVACNTASAAALRKIQQEFLPKNYPDRRVLGVVVPTLEKALESGCRNIGLIATDYIINSGIYKEELIKIDPDISIHSCASPLLVPLIENGGGEWLEDILKSYLQPLTEKGIDSLILGCTHYVSVKSLAKNILGDDITIFSQDDIIPIKLQDYLTRHSDIDNQISYTQNQSYYLSDITDSYLQSAYSVFKKKIVFKKVVFPE